LIISGAPPPRPLIINDHGVRFGVDVIQGQKTGFYLDQRDNRLAVSRLVRDHRVLDVFCYTGGFGLAALVLGGARQVYAIDASEQALATATANAELNGVSERFQCECSDAFVALERLVAEGRKFDTVILDPPKMVRHRESLAKALRGYYSLNELAVRLIEPDGLLVTCSCSGLVGRAEFEDLLARVSLQTRRPLQILEARGAAMDHPTSLACPENAYLKCYLCRVE
jgi:23S rRNA (cytosine1962-C5)-methyltransferase